MKNFKRLLRHLAAYKRHVLLNILCNIAMVFFSIVSIPAMIPMLQLLFRSEAEILQYAAQKPTISGFNLAEYLAYAQYSMANYLQEAGKEATLVWVCIGIVVLFFFSNLFRYLALFFITPVRTGIVRDVREQVFHKLTTLPVSYFSEERKGDLMSRITSDVQEIEWSILNMIEAIFREPLMILLSLFVMIYISPSMTAIVFLLILGMGVIIGVIGRTLRKKSKKVQEVLGNLVSVVEETLGGLKVMKAFTAEKDQRQKFAAVNNAYRDTMIPLMWRRDLSSPISQFLGICVAASLMWIGGRFVFSGEVSSETFIAFLFAFYRILDPAKSLSNAYYNIQKGVGALDRIDVILNAESNIKEAPQALPIKHFQEGIHFDNVSFSYLEGQEVLKDISITVPKGKILALVGVSGGGKSTLVDLLPRFYDVKKGGIFIDNKNIKDYKINDLRQMMGIVTQSAIVFNDSIYNNIVFGQEDISEDQVIEAAKIANAHDFIMQTEHGYQTIVGDQGGKLSGGQRQRITIARAILKNPPILILDEATSALDSESEKLVQEALYKLMQNRTSIVIAHRLSTIKSADEIAVLQAGNIIERGTHESLMQQKGEYRKLVEFQTF